MAYTDPRVLKDKVAIVTGASSGIGQAVAILFARRGASVVLSGRDQDRLDTALDHCRDASGGHSERFISISGDVKDEEVRQAIVDKTIQKFGRLDILVPNAGIAMPNSGIKSATTSIYDAVFDTNVKAVFFLIQAAIPYLEESKGNIVNMSSLASTMAMSDYTIYPMAKAAIDQMTRCLALDMAPKGVRVNAVNPSYIPTRIVRNLTDAPFQDVAYALAEAESSYFLLHGHHISVDDVAEMVAFLASDAAKVITGQCHIIDSGRDFMPAMVVGK